MRGSWEALLEGGGGDAGAAQGAAVPPPPCRQHLWDPPLLPRGAHSARCLPRPPQEAIIPG